MNFQVPRYYVFKCNIFFGNDDIKYFISSLLGIKMVKL